MIFDTHAHYNLSPLRENWRTQWQKAQQLGVTDTLIASSTVADSQAAIKLAHQDSHLFAAVGIHPDEATQLESIETTLGQLKNLIKSHRSKITALGEIGLDYYWLKSDHREVAIKNQKALLVHQLELAEQFSLPLIFHVRDQVEPEEQTIGNAYWDFWEILKSFKWSHPNLNCVLHCISGPLTYAKAAVQLGCYVGVDGNITYKNANHLRQLVKQVPPNRLLVETDAPFLPPVPYRGQTCEPWMISDTVAYLENELGVNPDQLYDNAIRFFNISRPE